MGRIKAAVRDHVIFAKYGNIVAKAIVDTQTEDIRVVGRIYFPVLSGKRFSGLVSHGIYRLGAEKFPVISKPLVKTNKRADGQVRANHLAQMHRRALQPIIRAVITPGSQIDLTDKCAANFRLCRATQNSLGVSAAIDVQVTV